MANGQERKATAFAIVGAKTRLLLLSFPGVQNVDQRNVQFVHSLERACHSNPNVCMNTKTHRRRVREREGERGEEMKQRKWDGGRGRSEARMIGDESQLERNGCNALLLPFSILCCDQL